MELRYQKIAFVDKIMDIVDDVAIGGAPELAPILKNRNIDPMDSPDDVRIALMTMDEYAVVRLYRELVGER